MLLYQFFEMRDRWILVSLSSNKPLSTENKQFFEEILSTVSKVIYASTLFYGCSLAERNWTQYKYPQIITTPAEVSLWLHSGYGLYGMKCFMGIHFNSDATIVLSEQMCKLNEYWRYSRVPIYITGQNG